MPHEGVPCEIVPPLKTAHPAWLPRKSTAGKAIQPSRAGFRKDTAGRVAVTPVAAQHRPRAVSLRRATSRPALSSIAEPQRSDNPIPIRLVPNLGLGAVWSVKRATRFATRPNRLVEVALKGGQPSVNPQRRPGWEIAATHHPEGACRSTITSRYRHGPDRPQEPARIGPAAAGC